MGIYVILIEPENPGNTGALCRVMKNFDFEKLVIVRPRFSMDSQELRNRAKWANDVIEKAKVIKRYDLKRLRKGFDYLIATTAKIGRDYNVLRSPITPEQLAERISGLDRKSKNAIKIGILFGREGAGLNNDEVAAADFTVTIPTSKKYGTMNLSHAASIILYEIFKKTACETAISHITPVSKKEKKQIMKLLDECMKKMDFLNDSKRETQRIVWKKMVSKSFLSKREAYALMGFLRKIRR